MKRDYWPTEQWRKSSPEEVGCDPRGLEEIALSIPEYGNITSVLAVKRGRLVLEAYDLAHKSTGCWELKDGAPPHTAGHYVFSVTKSVLSAVVGVAVDKGHIEDVNLPLSDFLGHDIGSFTEDQRKLRVKHLLSMTGGIDAKELPADLQGKEMIEASLSLPFHTKPGSEFRYDHEAAGILSALVTVTTGMNACALANQTLFEPMGINVDWGDDPAKDTPGGAGIVWTARDMAKFGYLFLNRGQWDGKQLLSEAWIDTSTRFKAHGGAPCGDPYGYLWWLGEVDEHSTYYAAGMHGQKLMVFPELDLVLAITCDQRQGRVRGHIVSKLVSLLG